VSWLLREAVL